MKSPRLAFGILALLSLSPWSYGKEYFVYFGTYTGEAKDRVESKGIYRSTFDSETGALGEAELAAETRSPSFLALSGEGHLFAVGEVGEYEGKPAGMVTAYELDASTGALEKTGEGSTGGPGPCHVSVNEAGRIVLTANYGGGSVSSRLVASDGSLTAPVSVIVHEGSSVNPQRQKEPHTHNAVFSPDQTRAYVSDLGTDKVHIYQVGKDGSLAPNEPAFVALPPGSGPRHFAFHPDGKRAYVINELLSTLTAFDFDSSDGSLTITDTQSTLPEDVPGNSTAEVVVHPSGKWVYGSNRGHNSIAVFEIDGGKLKSLGQVPSGGKVPRNFALDPEGKWLLSAHQDSDNVVVFKINPDTGMPEPTGSEIKVGKPVCVRFLEKAE